MNADLFAAAHASLLPARIAIALWLILASAQWITAVPNFFAHGPAPWSLMRGSRWLAPLRRRLAARILRVWLALQLAVAIALLFATTPPLAIACLILLLLSHGTLLLLVGSDSASGADKMGMIAMIGTLIVAIGVLANDGALIFAGCLATGGQLLLCYMVSGLSKLRQRDWRSGAELAGVMAHDIWGHPWTAALTRHRPVAFAASWILMLGEAFFPLALWAPQPWLIAALGAMACFHIATAVIMRLNLFPWSFFAGYPSVLLLADFIRAMAG